MSGSILQSGAITPGHAAMWLDNGTVRDAGPASGGSLTQIGVTNDGGQGLGINSGPVFGPYTGYGVSVSSDGTVQITVAGYNGGAVANLEYVINGVVYSFPGPGAGDVAGPTSSVDGDIVVFNGGTGKLLRDSGGAPQFAVPTIAALRARTASLPSITVDGYYALGDGNGGTFVYVPSDTTSSDNGGTIIVDAAGHRYYRQSSKTMNVMQFGAKGDGATDDTAAIQATFTWAATTGGTLTPADGVFQVSAPLTLLPGVADDPVFMRPGPEHNLGQRAYFRATAAMAQMLTIGGNDASYSQIVRNWRLWLGTWDCNGLSSKGIVVSFANHCVIRDTKVRNALTKAFQGGTATSPAPSFEIYFEDCRTDRSIVLFNISGITKANPAVVTTTTPHGLSNGQIVWVSGVGGMTQVNAQYFTVAGATVTTFQLSGIDSTGFGTYTSGGTVSPCGPSGTVGIFYENCSDMAVTNCVITGNQIGISGNETGTATDFGVWDAKLVNVHVWNFVENGQILYGFDLWGNVHCIGCQVDTPFRYAWHFRNLGNSLVSCQVDFGETGSLSNNSDVILIETGGGGATTNCTWVGVSSSIELVAEATGDLTNYVSLNNTPFLVGRSGNRGRCIVNTWGYVEFPGTLIDGANVGQVNRNAAGDYTVLTNNEIDPRSAITVTPANTSGSPLVAYEDAGARTLNSFRILFQVPGGALADPANFSVMLVGGLPPTY